MSLATVGTAADVNHKIIGTLTSNYTKRKNALFCTVEMPLEQRSKASSDSGTCAFTRRRARAWARLYFRMGLLEVALQVEAGTEVTVSQEVEVTQQTRTARVAVAAVTAQPLHKTPPQLSTK